MRFVLSSFFPLDAGICIPREVSATDGTSSSHTQGRAQKFRPSEDYVIPLGYGFPPCEIVLHATIDAIRVDHDSTSDIPKIRSQVAPDPSLTNCYHLDRFADTFNDILTTFIRYGQSVWAASLMGAGSEVILVRLGQF